MMLPRTVVPSQSMTAATNGTGMPGAAIETMVNARTSPSVGTGAFSNDVPPHEAHALRRSKYRAPHSVHWLATRCGLSPNARYSTNGTALPTSLLLFPDVPLAGDVTVRGQGSRNPEVVRRSSGLIPHVAV